VKTITNLRGAAEVLFACQARLCLIDGISHRIQILSAKFRIVKQ
jgi:hypothetical protein